MPRPDPREPRDPAVPGPAHDYPDPWYPDISIHLNDLAAIGEDNPDVASRLTASVAPLYAAVGLAAPVVKVALAGGATVGSQLTLSLGVWGDVAADQLGPDPADARRRGLLAVRTADSQSMTGSAVVGLSMLRRLCHLALMRASIASSVRGSPIVTFSSPAVTATNVSARSVRIRVSCFVVSPAGQQEITIVLTLALARNGAMTASVDSVGVTGDFAFLLDDVSAAMRVMANNLLAGFAPTALVLPDSVNAGGRIVGFSYASLRVAPRPAGTGPAALVAALNWSYIEPALSLSGPPSITLTAPSRSASYRAITTGMASPTFRWFLNGRERAETGPSLALTFQRGTMQPGERKTYRIRLVAEHVLGTKEVTRLIQVRVAPDP